MASLGQIDSTTSSTSAERPSVDELVARASKLVPTLRERGERIAQTRRQPDDVVGDIHDAGLMHLMRPRRYGGQEYGSDAICRIGRELGKGDGSTSWVYLVTAAHDVFMPLFPASVQEEYWASARPCGASSYAPTGKATPGQGGFVLSGKWSFCSGVDQAGWVLLGAIVGMLDNPKRPDLRYFLIPDKQFKVLDDWHVMGLRGTGSKSVVVENCFVPEERMLTFPQIAGGYALTAEGSPRTARANYAESAWVAIGFSLAAPATGILQSAYDLVVQECRGRMERRDPIFEAKKAAVQMHLGEASALIDTSDLMFMRSFRDTFARIAEGVRLTNEERVRNRRDTCYSVLTARKAADILMTMTGGHGINENHPVQRALRDLYAISAHPATGWDSPALSFGSVALGGLPTEPMC